MKYIFSWVLFLSITGLMHAQSITVTYAYDDLHRLSTATYSNGTTISFTYDVLGNRKSEIVTGACALATPSVSPQDATCGSSNGSLTVTATGTSLQYSLNGGLYQPSSVFSNLAVGSYTVSVKDANNCSINSQAVSIINVGVAPIANFTNSITNLTTTFTNTSTNATAYNWNFSNGQTSISPNPNVTFAVAGTYNVCLTASNTCTSHQTCLPVTVSCVLANVIIAGTTSFCQGSSTTLTASNGTTYRWSNGATTPSVLVNQSGTFTVTVTNSSGCTGSASQIVTVIAPPKADFGFNIQGGKVIFTSLSINAVSYLWRFGNDTTSTQANPTTNYRANQTYPVCLLVTNAQGCRDSICKTINITRVGVQDLPEGLSCSISPNPTRDIVKVQLDFYRTFGTNDKLVLVNVLGKLVFESNTVGSSNNLNISNLADGIYFVRLILDNKNYTLGKVVKN